MIWMRQRMPDSRTLSKMQQTDWKYPHRAVERDDGNQIKVHKTRRFIKNRRVLWYAKRNSTPAAIR